MSFTTPCFIRKNTPELRKKLEELGYRYYAAFDEKAPYLWLGEGVIYDTFNINITTIEVGKYFSPYGISCGTNEELFLALAALRDDCDYMQWFICDDNESMFKVDAPDMSMPKFIHEYMDGWDVSGARKATVEEIIEHFKDR